MFASITHIPSLHKILSNMPKHKLTISTSPNIINSNQIQILYSHTCEPYEAGTPGVDCIYGQPKVAGCKPHMDQACILCISTSGVQHILYNLD
jgi:hypothetical protein